jgi:hypothetical protein
MYNVTFQQVPVTTDATKKQHITYSESVSVTLVIQQAKHISHIILSSVTCPALHFTILSHNEQNFWRKKNPSSLENTSITT